MEFHSSLHLNIFKHSEDWNLNILHNLENQSMVYYKSLNKQMIRWMYNLWLYQIVVIWMTLTWQCMNLIGSLIHNSTYFAFGHLEGLFGYYHDVVSAYLSYYFCLIDLRLHKCSFFWCSIILLIFWIYSEMRWKRLFISSWNKTICITPNDNFTHWIYCMKFFKRFNHFLYLIDILLFFWT